MPDFHKNDFNCSDVLNNFPSDRGSIYEASPRMAEYIRTMENYLLVREKKVSEKNNSGTEFSV